MKVSVTLLDATLAAACAICTAIIYNNSKVSTLSEASALANEALELGMATVMQKKE